MPERENDTIDFKGKDSSLQSEQLLTGKGTSSPSIESSQRETESNLAAGSAEDLSKNLHGDPKLNTIVLNPTFNQSGSFFPSYQSATATASALYKTRPGHAIKSSETPSSAAPEVKKGIATVHLSKSPAQRVVVDSTGESISPSTSKSTVDEGSKTALQTGPFGAAPSHYGHIVVIAVDDGDASWHAFEYCVERVLHPEDTLILVHVYSPLSLANSDVNEMGYISSDMWDALSEEHEVLAKQILQKYTQVCKEKHIKHAIRTYEGEAREYLCRLAEDVNAKMVVVGSRGQNALKRFFLGSVSDYIVHNCTRPVLVIRCDSDIYPKSRRSSI